MKNLTKIAIIATVLLSFSINYSLKAQSQYQMPNSGFETFEIGFNGEGQQPTDWKGSNVVHTALGVTVRKTLVSSNPNGRTGNCVYLHNEMVGAMGIEAPAPAFIALGMPWNEVDGISADKAIGGCEVGIEFTYRPDTLELWIKRTYETQENARVLLYLWKGIAIGTSYRNKAGNCQDSNRTNEESDIRGKNSCTTTQRAILVGEGEWVSGRQFEDWTQIKVPVMYFNNEIPEKINIIISAANSPAEGEANTIKAGSKLWADDLKLIYSSKIDKLLVGGKSVSANFHTDTLSYTYSLGSTTTIPAITAFRAGRQLSGAEINITNGVIDGAPSEITVKAEDGSSSTTYKVYFVSQPSTPSTTNVSPMPSS